MALSTKLRHLCSATVKGFVSKPLVVHRNNQRISFLIYEETKNDLFRFRRKSAAHCCGFHTTPSAFKKRKTREEKKAEQGSKRKIIEYPPKAKRTIVEVWKNITLNGLANVLNKDLIYVQEMFSNKVSDGNTPISDTELLRQTLEDNGYTVTLIGNYKDQIEEKAREDVYPRPPAKKSELRPRPPVVTVMGHVDHGKTTLLDSLRNSRVVDKEFGGITQHIGAFSVVLETGARVTFLDTPGHAAFTAMRTRGAFLTDIIVLVVAADDGVMEQTLESIRMAREAQVPILVAINKIDSPKADIERTERMLAEVGVHVENLGGDVQAVPISALKKQNLDKLTEALVLQAEMLEIGADPTGLVEATVVESTMHRYQGKSSTVVVQRGTLKIGDILVAGTVMGKVTVLKDAEGKDMKEVPPGYPAEVGKWDDDLPSAGDIILQVETRQKAKKVIKIRESIKTLEKLQEAVPGMAEKWAEERKAYQANLQKKRRLGLYRMRPEGPRLPETPKEVDNIPKLELVVKADVDGSLEALLNIFATYDENEICQMRVIRFGVGAVSDNDVGVAKANGGVLYAFNVECLPNVDKRAEDDEVVIKHHNVIYKLIDDVKEEINSRLPSLEVEDVIGEATVLQMFEISQGRKKIPVAGCRCTKGLLKKSAKFKLVRDGEVLYTGPLSSIRHFKNEVDTVTNNQECGLQLPDSAVTFKAGDVIVCFQMKSVSQVSKWNPGF